MRRLTCALSILMLGAIARGDEGRPLVGIEIEGRLIDKKEKLQRFLGLYKGALFSQQLQERLSHDLNDQLGYRISGLERQDLPDGIKLKITVEPVRMVRNILVHGNFPLFDDDILRHLSVRSSSLLPPDAELADFLQVEAERVRKFLEFDGYFDSKVKIIPRQGPRNDWVDLEVNIQLGEWFKLGAVVPEGNTAISAQELLDTYDHCCFRWGRFELDRMREDTRAAEKKLRDRGYPAARIVPEFDLKRDADPRTRRVRLPLKIVEKRKVQVSFVGNRSISDKELMDQLTLFTSGAYDEIELAESARSIQRDYQRHGFFEARVSYQRKKETNDVEAITFVVYEGPELRVRGVEVLSESGEPLKFSSDEIRAKAQLETRVFPRLGAIGLGEGGYVTTTQLAEDGERIETLFKARGFSQAKVRPEVARDPSSFGALGALGAETAGGMGNKNDLWVRFVVDPGHEESVESVQIEFDGPHEKSEADLKRVMKLKPGEPYTSQALTQDQQKLTELYRSSGRPYMAATFRESTWNADHTRVALHAVVSEGAPVTFGEILIRGNFKTSDRVILKDLPFKPGDPFDWNKIELGERNLQIHGIFSSARVTPVGLADGRNPVPILVRVNERFLERFGAAAIAAGVATDKLPNYAYVSAGWLWSNFFGLGSQLALTADFGFTFVPPYVYGLNLRYTDVSAFGPGWRFDLIGSVRNEFTIRFGPLFTYGATLGLTRKITRALRAYGRYEIIQAQIAVPILRIEGPNDAATGQDNTRTGKLTLGITWDRRIGADGLPNPLMPTRGWLLAASVGWASPYLGGEHQFLVVSGQALGLLPFKVRQAEFTLIANLRYDEGIPFGEPALPLVERFFAGGDTTTRGYDPDTLKSEIVKTDVSPLPGSSGFRVVPQGGNIRMLSTVELQYPIAKTFLGLPWPWVGALFWDMGAIADAPNLIRGSDFKHSIGITVLRILTPVGPLSLEYAYPLTQTLAEERWKTNPWYSHFPGRIHFNWGIPLSRL